MVDNIIIGHWEVGVEVVSHIVLVSGYVEGGSWGRLGKTNPVKSNVDIIR